MNLITALFTGRRDKLTRKNIKLDAILVGALVVLLVVFGTVIKTVSNTNEAPTASAPVSDEIKENVPTDEPTFKIAELSGGPEADAGPNETKEAAAPEGEPSDSPSPAMTPEEQASAENSPSPSALPNLIRESDVVKNSTTKTPSPASSTPVAPPAPAPAPVAPAPVVPAPVTPAPPVAPPVVPVTPAPYPVTSIPAVAYRTTIHLNMRSGPGTEHGITGAGPTGTTVNGTGRASGIWYEVKLGGTTGWMSSQYLQKIETGSNSVASLQAFAGSRLENDAQLQCLITLWNRESNWNYTAINPAFSPSKPATPTYQAYGIAQAAPGNRMASHGSDWETNPRTQILWGLDYISGRYGTPCKALDHSYAVGWY